MIIWEWNLGFKKDSRHSVMKLDLYEAVKDVLFG
jgi:hypothetical protein